MSNFDIISNQDKEYVANTYGRFPVAIKEGKGALCKDFDGKEYIDFSSGIGVNSLGFCNEGWVSAVTKQLNTLQHVSNLYYTEPCINAAKLLCEKTGMMKVFFSNSGAESNEGAIKCARKYSFHIYTFCTCYFTSHTVLQPEPVTLYHIFLIICFKSIDKGNTGR